MYLDQYGTAPVNIAIKDATLEELVRRIEAGEHVTLTRDGKPFSIKLSAASGELTEVKKR